MSNIGNKLGNMLSNMGNMGKINELLNSKEGEKIKNSLSEAEKKAIIERFMSLDANEVKRKLSNFDASNLKGLTADDIMKLLKRGDSNG